MKRLAPMTLALLLGAATPGLALGPVAFGPGLEAQGWERLDFRGRTPAQFAGNGAGALQIVAESAVSVLYKTLPRPFADAAGASWRWRVDAGVPATDLSDRNVDDRSVALYFLFADDPATLDDPPTSLTGAMRRGRALIYVWGGDAARGTAIRSPQMFGRGQLVVLRDATTPTGAWQSETVDLRGDFRKVFGREPGPLMALAVSSDSDNSETRTEAVLSDLVIR